MACQLLTATGHIVGMGEHINRALRVETVHSRVRRRSHHSVTIQIDQMEARRAVYRVPTFGTLKVGTNYNARQFLSAHGSPNP